jgi:CCR4-NOT complex subunit CAF16
MAYIQDGELKKCSKLSDVNEMGSVDNLLSVVETWIRSEVAVACSVRSGGPSPFDGSPFRSSRQMAYYR